MIYELTIPMPLPSVANLREHWRTRARRTSAQRMLLRSYWRCNDHGDPPFLVVLTRQSPRRLDSDNLSSAFKGLRDEIAAMLNIDDGDDRIAFVYAQAKGPAAVRVRVQGA